MSEPLVRFWKERYDVRRCGCVFSKTTGKQMRPFKTYNRYLRVELVTPDGPRKWFLHRVIMAMHGPSSPGPQYEVCHLNGNPKDNRIENLSWVTHKENIYHKKSHGTWQEGSKIGNSKLCEEQVNFIRASYFGERGQLRSLAKIFGVTSANIRCIVKGATWRFL